MLKFESINNAYNTVFKTGKLSLGLVIPIENYASSSVPTMHDHLRKVILIEKLGFKALWVRDVPFHIPTFGDAGQTYDPFTYLGYLAGQTKRIALGISSIALPLHHPVHVAKAAATIDQLSDGRLIMGIASGDRYEEYPAMNIDYHRRDQLFREAYHYIRNAQESFPTLESDAYGRLPGIGDILPKAKGHKIPMLITGSSRQSLKWIAENGDGWMYYPRNLGMQKQNIQEWRTIIYETQSRDKAFMQPLYVDLHEDDSFKPESIHLGFRIGAHYLIEYFNQLQDIGVNHVAINLRFNTVDIETTLNRLAEKVLPFFDDTINNKTTDE